MLGVVHQVIDKLSPGETDRPKRGKGKTPQI